MNVNVRYIQGIPEWINPQQIENDKDLLDAMFDNLRSTEQVPTRQTTANACVSLNGVQVTSRELKSLSDSSEAGFNQ